MVCKMCGGSCRPGKDVCTLCATGKTYSPTPEEIQAECEKIRKTWSPTVRKVRAGLSIQPDCFIPRIRSRP